MRSFEYTAHPVRVVFGAGTLARLRAEVGRFGGTRVLLLTTAGLAPVADRAAGALGPLAVARFDGVAARTPVEVTAAALEVARERDADCLVSVGGGASTALGKAIAARTGLPLVAVPTTYAGSELEPHGAPKAVLYDVELTLGLPVPLSVASGLNALAHAVGALCAPGADPAVEAYATRAVTLLAGALPRIAERPDDLDARADALTGAWLAGMCLEAAATGPHHRLCHVLGGSFGLPHARTHAAVLPHAMAYEAAAAPEAMGGVAAALGVPDAPTGVYDLADRLGAATSLAALGLDEPDLAAAADLATAAAEPSTATAGTERATRREVTRDGALGVLRAAWRGARPPAPVVAGLTEQVLASFAKADPRTAALLRGLVRHLHDAVRENGVTEAEWRYAIDFLTRTGQLCSPTRQEFILLSDTLGVSSVVDALANSRTPDTTPSAVLGPFYVEGPPEVPHGADISGGLPGVPLWTDVRVAGRDGAPVPGAVVDVWQSNRDGFYDVQLPELEGPVLRARLRSGVDGRLTFWSILPAEYPIPDDGPVGQLLRATGRHPYRAPHLHFMISAPGHPKLVTQLFVAGGAYLDSDTVFGVKPELVVDFTPHTGPTPDGRPVDGEWRRVAYTFRLGVSDVC